MTTIQTIAALVTTLTLAAPAQAAFTDNFAPSAWQVAASAGAAQFLADNTLLDIRGPLSNSTASANGANYVGPGNTGTPALHTISFDWSFSSGMASAQASFSYLAPGDLSPTTVVLGSGGPGAMRNGSFSVILPAGSRFSFLLDTSTTTQGRISSELLISNFTAAPEASTFWAVVLLAGGLAASALWHLRQSRGRGFFYPVPCHY